METPLDARAAAPYQPDLRIGHLFGRSWPVFKENLLLMVGAFAIYALVTSLGSTTDVSGVRSPGLLGLISLILAGPLTVGLYVIALRLLRGEPTELGDLLAGFQDFGRAVGVYLLYGLFVFVGLLLLVVPGFIAAVSLWPALFLVADDAEGGIMDQLRRAWEMTGGHRMRLFGLMLVLALLVFTGLLVLFVGVLFAGAFATLVVASAYEELSLAEA